MSTMRYKVVLKGRGFFSPPKPEIYETACWTKEEAIRNFCSERGIFDRSDILEFIPLVVSKDGQGSHGEGFRTQGDYYDKPNTAFKAHTVHPKKLINSQWKVNDDRYDDHLYKITNVICQSVGAESQYDPRSWKVEYVEISPITKQIVRAGAFDMITPTYKRMELVEFMKRYYCVFLSQ